MDEMKKWLRERVEKKEIPDSLQPAQMEKRLGNVRQKKGGFSMHGAGLLLAAALLLAVLGVGGRLWLRHGEKSGIQDISRTEMSETAGAGEMVAAVPEPEDAKAFESDVTYEELYSLVKEYYTDGDRSVKYKAEKKDLMIEGTTGIASNGASLKADAYESSTEANTSAVDFSKTDLQVAGVEEGDRILTDGKYFYTVHGEENDIIFHILKADGDRTKEVSHMKFPACYYSNMYLYQNKLFLIGLRESEQRKKKVRKKKAQKKETYKEVVPFGYRRERETVLFVIDLSDKEHPKKEHTLTQDGYYKNSRLTNGYLYLFTVHDVADFFREDLNKKKPETYVPCVNGVPVAEKRIYAPSKKRDSSYTVMTSLALENPSDFCDKAAIYGSFQNFYMSGEYFYLTQRNYARRFYFDYVLNDDAINADAGEPVLEKEGSSSEKGETESGNIIKKEDMDIDESRTAKEKEADDVDKTLLLKYSYKDGRFSLQAKGRFEGEVEGSYAFHEYHGNLSVIYTKYEEKTKNGLYIFDPSLKKIGEIRNLGLDEEIYASYYIDHMAYFVTYRNTDPVFAVDIADPKKPRLCSELKLPGYSDYLHSFGEDYMIGLGIHGDGKDSTKDKIKISLFRIDEKKSLKEVAKEVTSYKSWDYDLIDMDHRQVFVDEERGLLGFYMRRMDGESDSFYYQLYQKKGEKFVELWKTKIKAKNVWYDNDALRGVRIGETFYVVTASGSVKTYRLS